MNTVETTSEVFLTAFRALPKKAREAVVGLLEIEVGNPANPEITKAALGLSLDPLGRELRKLPMILPPHPSPLPSKGRGRG